MARQGVRGVRSLQSMLGNLLLTMFTARPLHFNPHQCWLTLLEGDYVCKPCITVPVIARARGREDAALLGYYSVSSERMCAQVAGYAGLLLATPTVLYEVVAYVLPGLTRSERRLLAPIIFGSSILFYLGWACLARPTSPRCNSDALSALRAASCVVNERCVSEYALEAWMVVCLAVASCHVASVAGSQQ